ncbi:PE-PPE domain-containing protein [Mycobacterium sp. EPa45]|uniref:PE-PPE domain-containing protein n=1 Tax=Mycobacterium sp. EPa45 TaxID=1545728 RepID=UPI0009E25BFF|nr:PE-PPE domain-containing protein [Mycobacterium sp. EPa45]
MFKHVGLAAAMSAALIAAAPVSNAATVLTLEGGFVGMQHIWHFVPTQLQGDLCKSPNHCQPVDYFAFPVGTFTDQGATNVQQAIAALPADEQIVLFGHSQGGQVVYSDLRRFAADPANAPDPSRLTWVSIGNPENPYGGRRPKTESSTQPWLPPDTAYTGTEVIRQYDGWADWPDDTSNLLAVANAFAGMFSIHTDYRNVNLDDPSYSRFTPDVAGQPGNVTYVWVPTKTLPLIAWAGPFAPALDKQLRPIIEKAYHRPVDIVDPNAPSSAAIQPARSAAAPTRSAASSKRSAAKAATTAPTSRTKAKSSTASSARRH